MEKERYDSDVSAHDAFDARENDRILSNEAVNIILLGFEGYFQNIFRMLNTIL